MLLKKEEGFIGLIGLSIAGLGIYNLFSSNGDVMIGLLTTIIGVSILVIVVDAIKNIFKKSG